MHWTRRWSPLTSAVSVMRRQRTCPGCSSLVRRRLWAGLLSDWLPVVSLTAGLLCHTSTFPPPRLLEIIFPFILSFFPPPPPLLGQWILSDRKYSRRGGVVVHLRLWQTLSIGLLCIHKSIGDVTLANIPGSRGQRCWVDQVTLSLVMELWWSVTALEKCRTWRIHLNSGWWRSVL